MKSSFAILAAGVLAVSAAAVPSADEFEFLDIVPLYARQAAKSSPEKIECHNNCGPVIISGQSGTAHCSDDTWKEQFEYCMNCAIEHDIWKHYGEGVTHAADACNTAIELKLNGTAVANPLETASSTTASETTAAAAASTPTNDDSAASHMTSSSVGILFAMIAAAGLL